MNQKVLKTINRLDAHDRLLKLHEDANYISQGCEDCIKNRPPEFANHPFYIFAHKRELTRDERLSLFLEMGDWDKVPTHRLIWSPRLTKPEAQINSMLFKAYPPTDKIKVIWIIPDPEMWNQYTKGKLSENKAVCESIYDFKNNKNKLEAKEDDDLSDYEINAIYDEIKKNAKRKI